MTRFQVLALIAQEKRDDARAATRASLHGKSLRAYDGHTPLLVDAVSGEGNFRGKGAGGCGQSRMGRSERTRSGGLSFSRDRNANASRKLTDPRGDFTRKFSADETLAPLPRKLTPDAVEAAREHATYNLALALDDRDDLRAKGEAMAAVLAARTK